MKIEVDSLIEEGRLHHYSPESNDHSLVLHHQPQDLHPRQHQIHHDEPSTQHVQPHHPEIHPSDPYSHSLVKDSESALDNHSTPIAVPNALQLQLVQNLQFSIP